jgi:tetratricopeptide (TPR) repeat protein
VRASCILETERVLVEVNRKPNCLVCSIAYICAREKVPHEQLDSVRAKQIRTTPLIVLATFHPALIGLPLTLACFVFLLVSNDWRLLLFTTLPHRSTAFNLRQSAFAYWAIRFALLVFIMSRRKSSAAALAVTAENTPGSLSDVSDSRSSDEQALEVTLEEHYSYQTKTPDKGSKGVRRLTHLISGRTASSKNESNKSLQSAANYTVSSYETVKVSNIKQEKTTSAKKEKKRWDKLKCMMGVKTPYATQDADAVQDIRNSTGDGGNRRQRADTEDSANHFKNERRVRSTPDKKSTNDDGAILSRRQQERLDDSIRGRFDGVDILYMGGAQFAVPAAGNKAASSPWDAPMKYTFTGEAPHWSAGRMVSEMMWSSAGKDPPEILLEGIFPGADGRWSVRIEPHNEIATTKGVPQRQQTTTGTGRWRSFEPPPTLQRSGSSDDGSRTLSSHKLRSIIWGSNPVPADVLEVGSQSEHDENPIHSLAERCSIPIDIDDDSFLISTREHIQAIYDIVGLSLAKGQFHVAFRMLNTLLHGLDGVTDSSMRFVKGATLHNMGVLQLWQQAPHRNAVSTLQQALEERTMQLPPNHPDITVSLIRKANSCFAVGSVKENIAALEMALTMTPADHIIRAKVLNNLGIAYYFQRDHNAALKEFTKALEIQRQWLEGPLRRETTVYDAAVTLSNMGKVYLQLSDYDLAFYLYEEALLLLTTIFRKDHDMVLTCLTSLAMAKAQKGELDNALQILQGCLRSQNSRFGVLSRASIETVGLSGFLYARHGDFENALKCLFTVRKWQKSHLPEKHPALLISKESIRAIEAKLGTNKVSTVAKVWV